MKWPREQYSFKRALSKRQPKCPRTRPEKLWSTKTHPTMMTMSPARVTKTESIMKCWDLEASMTAIKKKKSKRYR